MWKINISGDLGQGWPTPKNCEESNAEEEEEKCVIVYIEYKSIVNQLLVDYKIVLN